MQPLFEPNFQQLLIASDIDRSGGSNAVGDRKFDLSFISLSFMAKEERDALQLHYWRVF